MVLGDYADTGPEFRSGNESINFKERSETSSNSKVQRPWTAEGSLGGPIDYGDPNDPNANGSANDAFTISSHIGHDPTVTDPVNPGEDGAELTSLDMGSIHTDMAGTLRGGGNPIDPNAAEAPAPHRPNTGDSE